MSQISIEIETMRREAVSSYVLSGPPRERPKEKIASPRKSITQLLEEWNRGDPQALEMLIPLVVDELRVIARRYFKRGNRDDTWQPTALVNELYIRLSGRRTVHWRDSQHFFCVAAQLMRRLIVDRARHRRTAKRGGGVVKLPLDQGIPLPRCDDPADLIALDDALERLKTVAPLQSRVVELKCFAGLTISEIAEALGIKPTTVKKNWRIARAWLVRKLRHRESAAASDLRAPLSPRAAR